MANDIIVDGGLDEILNRLVGNKASAPLYCAVGTANAAPVGTETTLGAEAVRVITSTYVVAGGMATLKAFFNTAQANGTVGEHGLFTGSDPTTNPGEMIDKGIEVPTQTKTATQEMLVEKVITLQRG